jgi:cell division protein FtsB
MEWLAPLALLLGGIGSCLAVYATRQGHKTHSQESQLALAWAMQEKQLDMLVAENKDLRARATNCESQIVTLTNELFQCKEGRRQLEVQVEILKLRRPDG